MGNNQPHPASFRDPSGFLFHSDGVLYRQINQSYADEYEKVMGSGLYEELVDEGLLIPHQPVDLPAPEPEDSYCVIQPVAAGFISYPYEWCFSQLKDAAQATLEIQRIAFRHEMSLKDASAFNIQFIDGQPTLIDTLSFETYREGEPWVPYRQFCQHFLAPLALMSYVDVRLSQLLKVYIDGIPLDLASQLLPSRTRLNFGLASHIHLHAKSQQHYADKAVDRSSISRRMNRNAFQGLIENLDATVGKLEWEAAETEWGRYYEQAEHYSETAFESKKTIVREMLQQSQPSTVWDLGANTGVFSRIASDLKIPTISFDVDPLAVEINYRSLKESREKNLLPLLIDLTNPTPAIGWDNGERDSFTMRGPVDTIVALALIHHLAISNNVPLDSLASFFQGLCHWLIIEFVPKDDSQVQLLLATREDIFPNYSEQGFETAFSSYFQIVDEQPIEDSPRRLYLLENTSVS